MAKSGPMLDKKPLRPGAAAIYLDGTRIYACILADDQEGIVEFIAKRRNGTYIVGEPCREDMIRVTMRGNVRIEIAA
jgi:hypothetical protein